jgi:hypothetical protein
MSVAPVCAAVQCVSGVGVTVCCLWRVSGT